MLHVALGVAAGMAHAKGTGQCCGGAIDIPEVRLFMYPQVVKKGDWSIIS